MLRVGLTGGIGAGKSAVARRLARNGAVIIDADLIAREVVAPGTPGLAEIAAAFGSGVLTADGELDRPALGTKVFGDATARRTLEKIIHPRVRARTAELTAAAPPDAIVVNDVPLLVETGLAATYHLVIVVEAPRDVRIARLTGNRGMTPEHAAARISAQADDSTRRAAADALLINDTGLDALHDQVDALFRDRLRPFEENLRAHTAAHADPTLRIVTPDPTWPTQAARLTARITHALNHSPAPDPGPAPAPGPAPVPGLAPASGPGLAPASGPGLAPASGLRSVSGSGLAAGSGPDVASGAESGSVAGLGTEFGHGESVRVCHIGSTAVPGLPAKDFIDLMLAVPTLAAADALAERLADAGFPRRAGEWADNARGLPGETWPKRLHGSADPGRTVNLHIRVTGSPGWRFALLMRDHLRAVPTARDEYAAAKARWSAEHTDRAAYSEAKEPWFDAEARAADDWAESTGWQPPTE